MNKSAAEQVAGAPEVQAKSGKYPNMVYSDFCRTAATRLGVEPIDMGYGDPANNKVIPTGCSRR